MSRSGLARLLPRGVALGLTAGFASGDATQHALDRRPAAGLPDRPAPGPLRPLLRLVDAAYLGLPPLAELRERATLVAAAVAELTERNPEAAVLDAAAGTGRLVRDAAADPRTVTASDRVGRRSADSGAPAVLAWDLMVPPPEKLAGRRFGVLVLSGFAEQVDDAALALGLGHLVALAAPGAALVFTSTPRYRGRRPLRLVPRTPRIVERDGVAVARLLGESGWSAPSPPARTPGGRFEVRLASAPVPAAVYAPSR